MKWLKLGALVLGMLVAMLALVPFFVALNDYIPAIEKEISARLREPVSIDSLHASALPFPHVTIDGITIGAADAEIKVAKVRFTPDIWSLAGARKVIRSVVVEDLTLSQKAVGTLVALTQGDTGSGGITVENVRLRGAVVKLERSSFGPFDADLQVSGEGRPGEVSLTTQDGSLKAKVTPQGERYAVEIVAKSWTPPLGPPIQFDELTLKGLATSKDAKFSDVAAKLYGGVVTGEVTVGWEKGVSIKGKLDVSRVELKEAAALISRETRLTGRLDAKPVFSAQAPKATELDESLRLETSFTVHNGVLHGFDISSAATSLLKQGAGGGQTRFDELSGHLARERGTHRFTQLRIASGGLAARGHVTVSPAKALSGQINANVKAVGTTASIPLSVAGTLDSPMLYPSTSALVGAAAGTAILGPGLGTAAGAKLGEMAGGLFGKKK